MDIEEEYDKIYRYCYFKTHMQQMAEDITQETFLRYFSQTTYINRGKPLAYLYTIARNLCNDHYRKQVAEPLDDLALTEDKGRWLSNVHSTQTVISNFTTRYSRTHFASICK